MATEIKGLRGNAKIKRLPITRYNLVRYSKKVRQDKKIQLFHSSCFDKDSIFNQLVGRNSEKTSFVKYRKFIIKSRYIYSNIECCMDYDKKYRDNPNDNYSIRQLMTRYDYYSENYNIVNFRCIVLKTIMKDFFFYRDLSYQLKVNKIITKKVNKI